MLEVELKGISFKTFFDPRYRPPTPVLVKWKVKSESESEKWIHFWSFKFFYILFFYLAIDEVDSGDQRKSLLNAARARLARGFIKEIPFKIQHVQD